MEAVENFEQEHFQFYVFNGEYYFYGWNNWSLFGTLTCFFDDLIERKILTDRSFKKGTLYSVNLYVRRDYDNPEILINFIYDLEKVSENRSEEVKRIANEVRELEEDDTEIIAERLDELANKLGAI